MKSLSVIVICKNEASNIKKCLESVKWADEIIVLDSGSTDETVNIARVYTPHVHITDWPGFGIQKNRALSYANGDWVLSIDADECVTPELKIRIISILKATNNPHSAWAIKRQSTYCGKIIQFGSWRNDFCVRLFKRGSAHFTEVPVHERLDVHGSIGKINELMTHESFKNLEEVLAKVNLYSTLGAKMRYESGRHQTGVFKALWHAFGNFIIGYVFRLGFLDGREGLLLAISNAEGTYYRYLKLQYLLEDDQ